MSTGLAAGTAQFQFQGDWNQNIEETVKEILLNTWQEWGFEEIDEEFIIFVVVIIRFYFGFSRLMDIISLEFN